MPHVRTAIVVGVLCAVAGQAAAETPRYRRKTPGKVDVELSERTRPKPRKPGATTEPPLPDPDAILAQEGEKRDLREQQIALLRNLIEDTPESEPIEKADLYFRLADTLGQLSRFHRLESVRLDMAGGQAAESKKHAKASVVARKDAEEVYETLIGTARYRAYPRMDRALFSYAFTLQQSPTKADRDRSRQVYERLLTEHPSSPYVPHAYLAFADYFFEENQLGNAESFYVKVLKFPRSNVYTYARFMLGWVYLNGARDEDAGREFLQVVRDTDGDPKQVSLHGAAQRDFVRAFSEFGDVRKAWPMLQKLDAASALGMMERLADIYVEKGKSDRAVYAYRQLLKEAPANAHVCAWQHDIAIEMLATPGATVDDKVGEIVRLAALQRVLATKKALPAAEADECAANAAAMTGELARAFHNEGAKTFDLAVLSASAKLYDAYIEGFPAAQDWGETAKYRAELAWLRAEKEPNARLAVELWEDAAAAFTRVVKAKNVPADVRKDAASGAVDAWRNALAVDPKPRLKIAELDPDDVEPGEDAPELPPPQDIPPRETSLLAAVDDYLAYVTDAKDPERTALTFVKARVLRNYNHHAEALPLLEGIIKEHPEHEVALYAAHLTLNWYVTTKQHAKVTAWGKWFAAHPAFFTALADQDRSDLRARVDDITRIALRIDAQDCETAARKGGDFARLVTCGNQYLAIFNAEVKRDPSAGVAEKLDQVLYNAGVLFEDGRSLSAAIDVYTELRERFPDSPSAARALARLGNVYARVAYYDRASSNFEEYAKKYAGEDDAFKVMNDAVIFRKGLGDDTEAMSDTAYFVKKFGTKAPGAAADAFFSMASILEKRGDLDAVVAHYRKYLDTYGAKGGSDRTIVAYARIGEILWNDACPVALVDGSCVKVVRERAVGSKATKKAHAGSARIQCGDDTKMKVSVVKRDPKKVAAAMAAFGQAIAEYERHHGSFPGGDARAARHSYALARFHRAEVDYETFLAVRFPDGLDFDPRHTAAKATSDKRLNEWFARKDALAGSAGAEYLKLVREVKDPAMAIAGAARLGQIAQTFSDALFTAEIPAFLRPYEEAVDLYCEKLETKGGEYEDRSVEAFGACLKASTDFGWFSSWSRLCERELGQIRPEDFPTSAELRAAPDAVASLHDIERPIIKIE